MGSSVSTVHMLKLEFIILFTFLMTKCNEALISPICRDCSLKPCEDKPVCCNSGWFTKDGCCGCPICAQSEGESCFSWGKDKPGFKCAPGLECVQKKLCIPGGSWHFPCVKDICVKANYTFVKVGTCDRDRQVFWKISNKDQLL